MIPVLEEELSSRLPSTDPDVDTDVQRLIAQEVDLVAVLVASNLCKCKQLRSRVLDLILNSVAAHAPSSQVPISCVWQAAGQHGRRPAGGAGAGRHVF